jgi:hypothetical protein
MASLDTLEKVLAKAKRAKKHIRELDAALEVFDESHPYSVRTEDDPNTSERSYYVERVSVAPIPVLAIVGDVLQNARSTLDHLVHFLYRANKTIATPGQTGFYIADKPFQEDSPDFLRKVGGASKAAIKHIFDLKPYRGGNDALWRLHRLNNIDKHRLLIALGALYMAHTMPRSEIDDRLIHFLGASRADLEPEALGMHFLAAPAEAYKRFPLKAGDRLLTIPISEVNDNMTFHVEVAFNEPSVVVGEPLVKALNDMTNVVIEIVIGCSRTGLF